MFVYVDLHQLLRSGGQTGPLPMSPEQLGEVCGKDRTRSLVPMKAVKMSFSCLVESCLWAGGI